MAIRMALKENLLRARTKAKLSQTKLAHLSGVSQQSISRLENGDDLTSRHLAQLARALNVHVSELDPDYALYLDQDERAFLLYQGAEQKVKDAVLTILENAQKSGELKEPSVSSQNQPPATKK